ncbi:helix-turn-helix domain-containing protein [Weissella bombi]|uniref:Cupin domain-containing protein n=1 Tax=Weissella bombi TaxID=1505725 RepID=A0A1C3YY64_9LACO|nr:XRE family transcriptional regulator [Weissella bombi]SCB74983.1 Cupin domain-containing protein [Weissella bombi]
MDINRVIANNLIRIRQEKKLSINKLAELSGISKSVLSQIEKQTTNPTINTIWKISSGLNVSYTELMNTSDDFSEVIQKNQTIMQTSDNNCYRIFCYFQSNEQRNFELFQVELDIGQSHHSVGHSSIGPSSKAEEYLLVIKGELTLTVGDKCFVINQDEAISFDATKEHVYKNTGVDMLVIAMMNHY